MNTLNIGKARIPTDDYAINANAILGIRGAGKTYMAKWIAEQLLDQGVPIVVFDPIGTWRFLRQASSKRGGKGYPIVVAGGQEPDLPLSVGTAPEILRAAMTENIPLVIDLYDKTLSKADWRRIVQDCFRILLYENRSVRHVFLEETAEFAPQKIQDGRTYAEVEKLVRMGGNASVGVTLINQRAQEVNKAVLDLCETMVLMRQRGSHAIDALRKWLDKISPDQAKAIAEGMPAMKHDAWVFLGDVEQAVRAKAGKLNTFHPDRRKPQAAKAAGAPLDISQFVTKMTALCERASQEATENDPKALKRRIIELERRLSEGPAAVDDLDDTVQSLEAQLEAERKAYREHLQARAMDLKTMLAGIDDLQRIVDRALGQIDKTLMEPPGIDPRHVPRHVIKPGPITATRASKPNGQSPATPAKVGDTQLTGSHQRILNALAWWEFIGIPTPPAIAVSFMAGYKNPRSGGFANPRSELSTMGLLEYPQAGTIALTSAGRDAAEYPDFAPSGQEFRDAVLDKLAGPERKILARLIQRYPAAMDQEELAADCGYRNVRSGGFANPRSRLSTLGLIEYPGPGRVTAKDLLFPELR